LAKSFLGLYSIIPTLFRVWSAEERILRCAIPVQEVLWTVDEGIFDSVPQLETLDIRPVLLLLPCILVHVIMHAYVYLILQS